MIPTPAQVQAVVPRVRLHVPETVVSHHPALDALFGREVWLKHEHQTPAGAFKVRGGIVYLEELLNAHPDINGVIAASTGNHGRSIAWSARRLDIACTIVVPIGNPKHKNAAIRSLGARLIESGQDFQSALEHSRSVAESEGLHAVPSYHPWLVLGVATYALELFQQVPNLAEVYVPIGLGSGASGVIAMRDAICPKVRVIGVVSAHAPAYALSLASRKLITHPTSTRLAEGVACSTPHPDALNLFLQRLDDIVEVTDEEVAAAQAHISSLTGLVVEGSGALSVAALSKRPGDQRVAAILSGGNVPPTSATAY
ncbi:MAG: threonine dehydratase [Verrucomicrobiaceae bacterium]|nr:threonine dehydratase [Verrucomicrobiaceae bacterium]